MTRVVWLTDIHLNFVESEVVEQLLDDLNAGAVYGTPPITQIFDFA